MTKEGVRGCRSRSQSKLRPAAWSRKRIVQMVPGSPTISAAMASSGSLRWIRALMSEPPTESTSNPTSIWLQHAAEELGWIRLTQSRLPGASGHRAERSSPLIRKVNDIGLLSWHSRTLPCMDRSYCHCLNPQFTTMTSIMLNGRSCRTDFLFMCVNITIRVLHLPRRISTGNVLRGKEVTIHMRKFHQFNRLKVEADHFLLGKLWARPPDCWSAFLLAYVLYASLFGCFLQFTMTTGTTGCDSGSISILVRNCSALSIRYLVISRDFLFEKSKCQFGRSSNSAVSGNYKQETSRQWRAV
jgi:hypothetical protein